MTKKILHSPQDASALQEHLIPVARKAGFYLVGIKSGNEYEYGMVVYTGKELTTEILSSKAQALGVEENIELFESYLAQMPNYKISQNVRIQEGAEFRLEYL
jgi:hypothetical protein